MPYKLLKNENYENLGGLNLKVSPYTSGPHEFLALSNYEFAIPGALNKRPGSSQYLLSQTGFSPMQGLYEFVSLEGQSMIMYAQNGNMYWLKNSTSSTLVNGLQNTQTYFKTFVDRVFFTNGLNAMKWDGSTTGFVSGGVSSIIFNDNLFSLSSPSLSFFGSTVHPVVTNFPMHFLDPNGGSVVNFPISTILTYSIGYVNERGFHGPPSSAMTFSTFDRTWFGGSFFNGNSIVAGVSCFYAVIGTEVQNFFTRFDGNRAASSLGIFVGASYGINYFGSSGISTTYDTTGYSIYTGSSYLIRAAAAIYRDNGPGTSRFRIGYAPLNPLNYLDALPFFDINYPQSTFPEPTCIGASGFFPRFLEIYNNQMFFGGFSLFPSIVQFSDIGEPESVQPGSNFELRTNDGDRVTGFKTYFDRMVMFKQNSFHILTGTDVNNFDIVEVSDQYGCLSHNAIAIYENFLLFLDKKGIVRYNGANIEVVSTKVESIFQQMNISAAIDKAWMIHYKNKNQVWCAIPINGSLTNNVIVVYDYLMGSWTRFDGLQINQLALSLADQPLLVPFFSDYSGMIYNFGPSFFGDNGKGITTIAQARFISDAGQSIQKLYRQLFLNTRSAKSATLTFGIKFYTDFSSTASLSTTLVTTQFQNRLDFGLSVKSISVEVDDFNSTDQQTIHGYALASRFLRDT